MGTIVTAAGWLTAAALAEITASSVARIAIANWVRRLRPKIWLLDGYQLTPLLYGSALTVTLTLLGAFPVLTGALLAGVLFGAVAWILGDAWVKSVRAGKGRMAARRIVRALINQARGGFAYLRDDIRMLLSLRHGPPPDAGARFDAPAPAAAPAASPRTVQVPRVVPSVRDDPALGQPPAPAEVAQGLAGGGVRVTPQWAALCESVAAHEPDTDEDEIAFTAAHAAGVLSYADAWRAKAESLLHGTGLDPAYVAGHHEFADEFADLAAALALVNQRFHVIYGALRDWVDEHPEGMPHKAREWLQGGGAGQQDTGPADEAA